MDIADLIGGFDSEVVEELGKGQGSVDGKPAPQAQPGPIPGDGGQQAPPEEQAAPIPPEEQPRPVSEESLKDVLKQVMSETRQEFPQQQPQAPQQEQPYYNPVVPPEIVQALSSEDMNLRQQGLSILIGGAMNKVRSDLSTMVRAEIQAAFNQVPNVFNQQQQQRAEGDKLREVFYEENPNFGGNQKRMQLVALTAMQLAQSMGQAFRGPDKQFRDMLAKHVEEITGIKAGKANPNPPAPPQRRYQSGGSNTRSANANPSLQDEIWDVIGGPN